MSDLKHVKLDEDTPQNTSTLENKLELSGFDSNSDSLNNKNISLAVKDLKANQFEAVPSKTKKEQEQEEDQHQKEKEASDHNIINSKENTLDEPVTITLRRELKMISIKLMFIVNPLTKDEAKNRQILQWDLWGPLTFIIILSTLISFKRDSSPFYIIFTIFWLGCIVLFFNTKFLGGQVSFFSLACLLGYSLVPFIAIALLLLINMHIAIRAVLALIAGAWSIYVSIGFLRQKIPQDKQFIILFPIGLFFSFYSLLLIIN